jgi:hypothetical protein
MKSVRGYKTIQLSASIAIADHIKISQSNPSVADHGYSLRAVSARLHAYALC